MPGRGGGGLGPRTTGAKALFCLTAVIILAGENENIPGAHDPEYWRGGECDDATEEHKETKNNIKRKANETSRK